MGSLGQYVLLLKDTAGMHVSRKLANRMCFSKVMLVVGRYHATENNQYMHVCPFFPSLPRIHSVYHVTLSQSQPWR